MGPLNSSKICCLEVGLLEHKRKQPLLKMTPLSLNTVKAILPLFSGRQTSPPTCGGQSVLTTATSEMRRSRKFNIHSLHILLVLPSNLLPLVLSSAHFLIFPAAHNILFSPSGIFFFFAEQPEAAASHKQAASPAEELCPFLLLPYALGDVSS